MRISDWSSDVCSSALAFLQHLARRVLAVVHQLVGVDRLVLLSVRGVDADLAEQAFHAEGARLVGDDRHQPRADLLVPECNVEHLRSEEHTSELKSLMRTSYAVFCLKKKNKPTYALEQVK